MVPNPKASTSLVVLEEGPVRDPIQKHLEGSLDWDKNYLVLDLNITQEDIDKGEPESDSRCPIALSLLRELGPNLMVSVEDDAITVYDVDNDNLSYWEADTPEGALKFIEQFDAHKAVEPCYLHVELFQNRTGPAQIYPDLV